METSFIVGSIVLILGFSLIGWLVYRLGKFIYRILGFQKAIDVVGDQVTIASSVIENKVNVVKTFRDKAELAIKKAIFRNFTENELRGIEGKGLGLSSLNRKKIREVQDQGNSSYVIYHEILQGIVDLKTENAKTLARIKEENPPRISGYEKQSLIQTLLKTKKVPIFDPKSRVVSFYKDETPCFADSQGFNKLNFDLIPKYTKEKWAVEHKRLVTRVEAQAKKERDIADVKFKAEFPEFCMTPEEKKVAKRHKEKGLVARRVIVWFDRGLDNNYCCRVGSQCSPENADLISSIESIVCAHRFNDRLMNELIDQL